MQLLHRACNNCASQPLSERPFFSFDVTLSDGHSHNVVFFATLIFMKLAVVVSFASMTLGQVRIIFLACFFASLGVHLPVTAAEPDTTKPNIIFFMCDDLGWADLPAYGLKQTRGHGGWKILGNVQTPQINRLAQEGTRYLSFYANGAVCSPARTGMMTGRFPSTLGVHDYFGRHEQNVGKSMPDYVDPQLPNLANVLKQQGYRTAHFGKWHLNSNPESPSLSEYGFDEFTILKPTKADRPTNTRNIVDHAVKFIAANQEKPFYLNVWLRDPHSPLHPSQEQLEAYKNLGSGWPGHPSGLQVYFAVISEIDRQLGRILQSLDEHDLAKNTIVIFTSDNGPEDGLLPSTSFYGAITSAHHGPFRGAKRSLYEGGIRVPMIVRWPGRVKAGALDAESLWSGVDLLPTLAAVAGAKVDGLDGEDLSALLNGESTSRQAPLYWENRFPVYGSVAFQSPILAVRSGKWKLLMNPDRSRVELYNIPQDPSELNNLVHKELEITKELSAKVLKWSKSLQPGFVHPLAGKIHYLWPQKAVPPTTD